LPELDPVNSLPKPAGAAAPRRHRPAFRGSAASPPDQTTSFS
jgi:hypothetical protein